MNTSTQTIDPDAFWAFSLRLYANPHVKEACLKIQNEWESDVNLILLLAWLTGKESAIASTGGVTLLAVCGHWQASMLIPFRQKRRNAKVTPQYELLKSEELQLEKQEQRALCNAISTHLMPSKSPIDMIEKYFQEKDVSDMDLRTTLKNLMFSRKITLSSVSDQEHSN